MDNLYKKNKAEHNNAWKKKLLILVYKALSILTAFFSSIGLWYWNISPYWSEGYKGYITLTLVGILYCIIYWVVAKAYRAVKIGIYRLMDLTYFQLLSFGMADVVLFVESVVWFHNLERLRIWTYFVVLLVQMLTITIVIFICNRIFAIYDEPRKILIIHGEGDGYLSFIKKIKMQKKRQYLILGCFGEHISLESIQDMIDESEGIYLYEVKGNIKKELILYCDAKEKDIYLTQEIEDLITMGFDISHTFDTPFIRTKRIPVKWYYPFVKRCIDILVSGISLVILSPILLIVSMAIKLYDGGPVIYKQLRLTKGYREFYIYKFRSMITDAEKSGARLASRNDSRITPIGKLIRATRIDELPQLINILKGDMSLVGPRPERPEIEKKYLENLPEFSRRLKVKAGLTGYAQVFGKYNTTPSDKLKLDLLYINQQSLFQDFRLIFHTVKILFILESTEGVDENTNTVMVPPSMQEGVGINKDANMVSEKKIADEEAVKISDDGTSIGKVGVCKALE